MKRLAVIVMLGTALFGLPALALAGDFDDEWDVELVNDQLGNVAPTGSICLAIVDTEHLGLSAFTSISPSATLSIGGGLLQTSGQANGCIASIYTVGYIDGYAGGAHGLIDQYPNTNDAWAPGQPTTLHAYDPIYVMWFPTFMYADVSSENMNIPSVPGTVGAGTWYGIFRANDNNLGDGWVVPAEGWSVMAYAGSESMGGSYPDSTFDAAYQTPLSGDANGDGTVDINDLTIVLAHYGQTGAAWAQGEFTGDGTVDINDLTIVLAHYGQSAGSAAGATAAVPEPCVPALLAAGLACLLARAWRKRK
jgi:hypothetical protein